ncbi:hypothetical protein [Pseudonocardia pini]|uniref:hypothetical protein n=1 Tax=Pseudonocardia pini TaxID=2758030 RepID=UPI0015F03FF0|nr:hypothetical protein [Pseudonocardia pini]
MAHNSGLASLTLPNRAATTRWTYVVTYFPGDARYVGAPSALTEGAVLRVDEPLRDLDRFPVVFDGAWTAGRGDRV